jgi:hypothetical protein
MRGNHPSDAIEMLNARTKNIREAATIRKGTATIASAGGTANHPAHPATRQSRKERGESIMIRKAIEILWKMLAMGLAVEGDPSTLVTLADIIVAIAVVIERLVNHPSILLLGKKKSRDAPVLILTMQ